MTTSKGWKMLPDHCPEPSMASPLRDSPEVQQEELDSGSSPQRVHRGQLHPQPLQTTQQVEGSVC